MRLSYKALINTDLPVTGGTFATLEVLVPEDCIFNAKEPAACEWYFTGLGLLCDLIVTALGPAIGDQVVGPHYGDSMVINVNGVDPARRRPLWVVIEPTAGGWGAYPGGDGESALINLTNGSFKNIPVEVYESKFPVRIERFAVRKDSGGAGRYRGGCGVVRDYRLLSAASVSVWFERSVTPAWGLAGGGPAMPPVVVAEGPAGSWSGLKANRAAFPAGTLVTIETGGGGSYGPAFTRPPEDVARDVRERYVSLEAARDSYGVVIDPDTLEVDNGGDVGPARRGSHKERGEPFLSLSAQPSSPALADSLVGAALARAARFSRVRDRMREMEVDAVLLSFGADLPWLTGYEAMPLERLTMLVLPVDAEATLVVPELEAPRVDHDPQLFDLRPWTEDEQPAEIVAAIGG